MDGVIDISAGNYHTLALKEDGSLFAWGKNDFGQIGDGTYENCLRPVKVMDGVVSMSGGSIYSLAIKKDGTLWAWGNNAYRMFAAANIDKCNAPQQVLVSSGERQKTPIYASSVSAGAFHMLITAEDGRLLGAGNDDCGQLGDGGEIGEDYDKNEDFNKIHLVEVMTPEG